MTRMSMTLNDEELSRLYRQQTRRTAGNREACLPDELLLRAASGKLSGPDRDKVVEHLSICSDCATEYRLIRSMQVLSLESACGAPRAAGKERRWFFSPWSSAAPVWALAMSLLIITIAVGAWAVSLFRESQRLTAQIAARDRMVSDAGSKASEANTQISQLQGDLSALSQPQLNTPVVDLDPRDSVRGAGEHPSRTIPIPPQAKIFTLILNISDQRQFPDYGLDIVAPGGALVWSGRGLHRSTFDTFTMTLPHSLLSDGEQYQFALYGLRGSKKELIENYRLRIQR